MRAVSEGERGGGHDRRPRVPAHLALPPPLLSPERRRAANRAANNGLERKDLYTDAWAGSEWRGGKVNVLSVLIVISILTPAIGLAFAIWSYGVYWG